MNRLTKKGTRMINDFRENDWYNKLANLEDIEEELGCPLEVVFNVLKGGSIEDEYGGVQIVGITIGGDGELYLHAINGDLYLLKDYQKTWVRRVSRR